MIDNNYLNSLYLENDVNYSMNEVGELFKQNREKFLEEIKDCCLINLIEDERVWLTQVSAYICVLLFDITKIDKTLIPDWLLDGSLRFESPLVIGFTRKDLNRLKLIVNGTAVMKYKNVYFDKRSLIRV